MHPTGPYAADLTLALAIADEVDRLTTAGFANPDLTVETKSDLTPVTAIDRGAEELIRERLATERPGDALLGEEFGATGEATRQWIVDPVDGTKNFIRGIPVWATLIALLDDGKPVVGVVSAPALGRRWFAATDDGAWLTADRSEPTRLSVSKRDSLADATLAYSSLSGWDERGLLDRFLDLTRQVWRTRGFGDFWSYMMVAEGAAEIACEPELSLWDMAALVPIVEEAGGRFTSLAGEPGPHGADAIASNGLLHDDARRILGV